LADCYSQLAFLGFVPPKEGYPRAKEAALKAMEIDDTLAEGHASLAFVEMQYDWDWSGAEKEFRRAIALNPSYAAAHQWYAIALRHVGRLDEAMAEQKRALELDPLSLIINLALGVEFSSARQNDLAIEQLRKTVDLDPNFVLAYTLLGFTLCPKIDVQRRHRTN
jgi:tetratricopeptide (TPR) repeat protein